MTSHRVPRPSCLARAFTLVELLVVIAIIAVVIAIVLPALAGVRNVARKTNTQQLITNVMNATTAFQLDNERVPGYFTPAEMGDTTNETRGMSAMQNAMLELAGGFADPGASTTDTNILSVGPDTATDAQVLVDVDRIGIEQGESLYFVPDQKNFKTHIAGQMIAEDDHLNLPSVVDAWGNPLLLWVQDSQTRGARYVLPGESNGVEFARIDSGNPAAFYWNSNACFLAATSLGDLQKNHTTLGEDPPSLIGTGFDEPSRLASLTAMLGHPAYPDDPTNATLAEITPTTARGAFVLQSAGRNGVYLDAGRAASLVEASGASFASTDRIDYGRSFELDGDGNRIFDEFASYFDDMIMSGGN